MQKKRISVLIILLTMVLLFTACNQAAQEPTPTATKAPTPTQPPVQDATDQQGGEDTANEMQASAPSGYDEGSRLPDFTVPLVGGGAFKLSDNSGKPVFINLFATWCPPCVGEMPEINKLYGEYGDDVVFIVIDIGEDESTAQQFASKNSYSLPFAYSLDGAPLPNYAIEYIPQTFVLNADGTIVKFFAGGSDYESFKAAIEEARQ